MVDEPAVPALQASRHPLSDAAQANDAHRLVREFIGSGKPRGPDVSRPLTVLDGLELQMQFSVDTDHQGDGVFGDRYRIAATVVRYPYAQLLQRRNVDQIRARTDGLYELQLGTFQRQFHREGRGGGDNRDGFLQLRCLLLEGLGGINPFDLDTFWGQLSKRLQLTCITARQDIYTRAHEALLRYVSELTHVRRPLYRPGASPPRPCGFLLPP